MAKKDWLRVILVKEGNEPEAMPVSFVEEMGEFSIGILEMEPSQDFGYHKGDKIGFFPYTDDQGTTILVSDMNPSRKLTAADMEGGTLLKEAITVFNNDRNEPNLFEVMELLRDSYVWIPCNAVMSDVDQKRMQEIIENSNGDLESLTGMEFVSHGETRLIPDILQKGDEFFFPVFSSEEEMGEYGENFSKLEKHFLEALVLAKNNDKELAGIVVNAFSEPFVLDSQIWDLVEKMNSRLSE